MSNGPRKVPKVQITEDAPISKRIAWYFENSLIRFSKRVFNAIGDNLRSLFAFSLEQFIDLLEEQTRPMVNPIIDDFLKRDSIPQSIKNVLIGAKNPKNAAQWKVQLFSLIAGILSLGNAYFSSWGRLVTYESELEAQSHRPDPSDTILMQRFGALSNDESEFTLKELGLSDRYVAGYRSIMENLPDDNLLINAWLRDNISDVDINSYLEKKGYTPFSTELLKKMSQLIPGPQDLIRMAVREAWNDGVASRFGYDADFPAEFAEWAEKIGLDTYWTKKYWRAHWELPGVREGFEMLHRRIIDNDDVQLLLRSRDIPQFWRDSLIELSYNPYTRVDVRRMYAAGVLSIDEVYNTYRDIGYDDEHAQNLTDWTVQEYGESSRDLTKTDIISAYRDNTLTSEETTNMLLELGFDNTEIAILLARADLRKQQDYEKEFTENVRLAYVARQIDENDVFSRLSEIDPPTGFIEERLSLWNLQRERELRKPTKTDIQKFLLSDIISQNEARQELASIGYPDYVIEWYLELWLGDEE